MHISTEAFFDELEKIAKKKKKKSIVPGAVGTAAGLVGGGLAGGGLSAAGSVPLVNSLMAGERGLQTTADDIQRLQRTITDKPLIAPHMRGAGGAAFAPHHQVQPGIRHLVGPQDADRALKHGIVLAPKNTGAHITAHELGHARFGSGRIGGAMQSLRTRTPMALRAAGGVAPLIAASVADPDSAVSKYAPVAGAALAAPTLIDEAAASIGGYRGMRRAGYSPQALRTARRQLAKAFGTYAVPLGAMGVAAPMVARALKKRTKKALEEE